MGYQIKSWKNRQSEYPNRRALQPVAGAANTYEVARAEGIITEEGHPFDQATMNDLESRVAGAFDQVAAGTLKAGAAAVADSANAVAWAGVTGKPALYTQGEVDTRLNTKLSTTASCNKNWNWSGQGGQPSWLWGGNDPTNEYLYNPANFNVSYAAGAGNADTVDGFHIAGKGTAAPGSLAENALYFVYE